MEKDTRAAAKQPRQFNRSLGYIRNTRHDILTTLSISASCIHHQDPTDHDALRTVAAYICNTKDIGLTFQAGPENADIREPLKTYAYSDAS